MTQEERNELKNKLMELRETYKGRSPYIGMILATVAGTVIDGSEAQLAVLTDKYSSMRLTILQQETADNERIIADIQARVAEIERITR